MAWSVDRLGRSLQGGKALFQMMGVFAEFERAMIRERVNAGLARARARGKRLGRPRITKAKENRIRALLRKKVGMVRIAQEVGCGVSVVQRVKSSATT